MEVCEKCGKPIDTLRFKDKRSPFFSSDIRVTVVVNKTLCLVCVMKAVRALICDYDNSEGNFCEPEVKEAFKFQSARYG